MKWLLVVVIFLNDKPNSYREEFKTKEECVYIGNWFTELKPVRGDNIRIYAKCFEVQNVQK